jgi:hypothetical protein
MFTEIVVAGLLRRAIEKNPEPQLAINQLAARTLGKSRVLTFACVWLANKGLYSAQYAYHTPVGKHRDVTSVAMWSKAYSPVTHYMYETNTGTAIRFSVYSLPVIWGMLYGYTLAPTRTWSWKVYTPVSPWKRAFVRVRGSGDDDGGIDSGIEASD